MTEPAFHPDSYPLCNDTPHTRAQSELASQALRPESTPEAEQEPPVNGPWSRQAAISRGIAEPISPSGEVLHREFMTRMTRIGLALAYQQDGVD